jgi:hypothetical protein
MNGWSWPGCKLAALPGKLPPDNQHWANDRCLGRPQTRVDPKAELQSRRMGAEKQTAFEQAFTRPCRTNRLILHRAMRK